ncbi:hypothetical protein ACIPUD_11210 [Bradyrhizobium sp. CAR08]
MSRTFNQILAIYEGSDGEATKAMYVELETMGPIGLVAINLFRACKTSGRAKNYRGRRYKGAAYDTKQWSMENLAKVLSEHGDALGIVWGWERDEKQEFHNWVLYVDTPRLRGQVSFHTAARGQGPDYPGAWDGVKDVAAQRICRFLADVFVERVSA